MQRLLWLPPGVFPEALKVLAESISLSLSHSLSPSLPFHSPSSFLFLIPFILFYLPSPFFLSAPSFLNLSSFLSFFLSASLSLSCLLLTLSFSFLSLSIYIDSFLLFSLCYFIFLTLSTSYYLSLSASVYISPSLSVSLPFLSLSYLSIYSFLLFSLSLSNLLPSLSLPLCRVLAGVEGKVWRRRKCDKSLSVLLLLPRRRRRLRWKNGGIVDATPSAAKNFFPPKIFLLMESLGIDTFAKI